MAWIVSTKVDTYQQPRESVRGGSAWGGRTVGAMDGAIEPQGRVYGVSCHPTPTHPPSVNPLLLLLLLLLLLSLWPLPLLRPRRVPGAARP